MKLNPITAALFAACAVFAASSVAADKAGGSILVH